MSSTTTPRSGARAISGRGGQAKPPNRKRRSVPKIEPRIRERKLTVARDQGRRRLRLVLGIIGVVVLGVVALVVLHSSLFSARTVRVFGAVHTSETSVLSVSGLSAHPALISVNTGADATSLEMLPWVKSAKVTRSWPSTVVVRLTERTPIAIAMVDRLHGYLLDQSGRVLARVSRPPSGVVSVLGLGAIPAPGGFLPAHAGNLLAVAAAIPISLEPKIASLAEDRVNGLTLQLLHGPRVVLATTADLRQKMVSLATLLATSSHVSFAGIVTIDLRVPAEPVLTP